jgi:hypothetical protein
MTPATHTENDMLIPLRVLNLHRIAAQESTRYLMNVVRFERDDDMKPLAVATDSKALVVARWDETAIPVIELPDAWKDDSGDQSMNDGFNVPVWACRALLDGLRQRARQDRSLGWARIIVDSSHFTLSAPIKPDPGTGRGRPPSEFVTVTAKLAVGNFPDWKAATKNADKSGDTPQTRYYDAKLLTQTLGVIADIADAPTTMTQQPQVTRITADGKISVLAYVMPLT